MYFVKQSALHVLAGDGLSLMVSRVGGTRGRKIFIRIPAMYF
jgi:hypothetical protein